MSQTVQNKHVLFLDDDPDVIEVLRLTVSGESFESRFFTDAYEAEASLKNGDFAVVVCDVRMPQMSGIDFVARAKAINPNTVCINMSSTADMTMVIEALHANQIYDFFKKPLKKDKLISRLYKAIERFNIKQTNESLAVSLKEKNRELGEWNRQLDDKVREQTMELQLRDQLLQHLAGTQILEDPFEPVAQACARLFAGCGLVVYGADEEKLCPLYHCPAPGLNLKFGEMSMPDASRSAPEVPAGLEGEQVYFRPLQRCGRRLGWALLYAESSPGEERQRRFESWAPLISLLVYDQQAMDDIDRLHTDLQQLDIPS